MNGLRIGWAAPWDEVSVIAQLAAQVGFELSRVGHSVTVLRTEVGQALDRPPQSAPGAVLPLAGVSALELRQNFDVLVAHIGNGFEFHGAILPWLRKVDIVGIFYDPCVGNLIGGWSETGAVLPDEISARAGKLSENGGRWMLDWLAGQMAGAVVHADRCARRVRDACPGPVAVIPSAFSIPELPPMPSPWSHMIIGVVGGLTGGDRIDQLILSIAASPVLRRRCLIKIIGDAPEDERARLDRLARSLRVEALRFTGHAAGNDLRWLMRDVDVLACFNPWLGRGAVMMAVAQMSKRPILVTDQACQIKVAADKMLVCSAGHEARDAVGHLERLLDDPHRGIATSKYDRSSALCRRLPVAYAESLIPLLEEVVVRQPERSARRRLIDTLSGFGLPPNDPAAKRVEAVLASLVSGSGETI